jgi:hypothetical protein
MAPCTDVVLSTQTFTLTSSSKIFGSGQFTYSPNGASLHSGEVWLELRNGANTVVARTDTALASVSDTTNDRAHLSVGEILRTQNLDFTLGADYVAAADSYTLNLIGSSTDGACSGSPTAFRGSMSYLLVGL